jgi:acylglycerol kinase
MRAYCEEARKLGDERIDPFKSCPHITVLFNPEAKGRKCKGQFDNLVAPILHCAGVRVSFFETDSKGQAEQLMRVMDKTDGVLVAGGDGTVHEVITGWLQRPEAERTAKPIAIAVLPLGKKSRSYHLLQEHTTTSGLETAPFWQSSKVEEARQLAECALRVAKDERRQANVVQVSMVDEQVSLYALSGLEFGQMAWLSNRFAKYWYLGQHLGQYYALMRNTFWQASDTESLE